jgi:broad specificity phosphatase PhoE
VTRIVFVRHGESEANVGDFINDDPRRPVGLTARGIAQAEQAAVALRHLDFGRAFSSEFPRARQTAALILGARNCALGVDARLNERRSGMDGLPTARFNDLVRADPLHIRPPLGESFLEQMARLRGFLDDIAATESAETILAVSHENPILAVRALAGEEPEQAVRGGLPNCAWLVVEHRAQTWRIVEV